MHVCPLSALEKTLKQSRVSWMISLAGPGKSIAKPTQITGGFLSLEFNDIAEQRPNLIAPNKAHIEQILTFGKDWAASGEDLLIHCWMGISRSTAAALLLASQQNPEMSTDVLAETLRRLSPMATPNPLMISLGDTAMKLDGSLVNSVAAIGRGANASEGVPFEWAI